MLGTGRCRPSISEQPHHNQIMTSTVPSSILTCLIARLLRVPADPRDAVPPPFGNTASAARAGSHRSSPDWRPAAAAGGRAAPPYAAREWISHIASAYRIPRCSENRGEAKHRRHGTGKAEAAVPSPRGLAPIREQHGRGA